MKIVKRVIEAAQSPAQLVVVAFAALVALGAFVLWLPVAVDPGQTGLGWRDSLFTSTSATTVTGLGTIDISHLSLVGELAVLTLIQVGGFGIMTVGSVLALAMSHRVGLRQRMLAQAEIGAVDMGELRFLIAAIARITLAVEAGVALLLFISLIRMDGYDLGSAAYHAVFHSVSGFNNAGISLYPDSLTRFASNPFVVLPVSAAFIVGGFGFPVLVEFWRRVHPRRWSLHTRIMLVATLGLLVVGPVLVLISEWSNPETLGPMGLGDKLLAAWFQGTTPRTAGFNTVDIGAMEPATLLMITALMFVGAGPASTSGGIKLTTFMVLLFALWSEVRGVADVNAFRRRISEAVIRQAIAVALLAIATVFGAAMFLTAMSSLDLLDTLFEAASAFGTVGLSTGITPDLPGSGQLLLVLVMFAGRVGPVTFATALALQRRPRTYRYAEERPIIG